MLRKQRLQSIRRLARYHDYLATMPDPASLSRAPTRLERAELARAAEISGTRAGAAWAARQRGR
jgi:hypothetical protein